MESEIIDVPTEDPKLVMQVIERVNGRYGGDFRLLDTEYRDGVMFALVDRGESSLNAVFMLGYFYGVEP